MSYLFRDTDLAARRLQVLASVFAPASRAFLQDTVRRAPQLAIDLGCGPGYTTHLLADTTHSLHTIGLDGSEHFLTLARQQASTQLTFAQHDVTCIPFPSAQADLIFCRFLLTHLQKPQTILESWSTQLHPGGLLLIEEVEWIETTNPHFCSYLSIVATMLEQQANQLYIGPFLATLAPPPGFTHHLNRVYRLPVVTADAATMFSMNIPSWKSQPFIQQHYADAVNQLEHDLGDLTRHSTTPDTITWGMRQIAYLRS